MVRSAISRVLCDRLYVGRVHGCGVCVPVYVYLVCACLIYVFVVYVYMVVYVSCVHVICNMRCLCGICGISLRCLCVSVMYVVWMWDKHMCVFGCVYELCMFGWWWCIWYGCV